MNKGWKGLLIILRYPFCFLLKWNKIILQLLLVLYCTLCWFWVYFFFFKVDLHWRPGVCNMKLYSFVKIFVNNNTSSCPSWSCFMRSLFIFTHIQHSTFQCLFGFCRFFSKCIWLFFFRQQQQRQQVPLISSCRVNLSDYCKLGHFLNTFTTKSYSTWLYLVLFAIIKIIILKGLCIILSIGVLDQLIYYSGNTN